VAAFIRLVIVEIISTFIAFIDSSDVGACHSVLVVIFVLTLPILIYTGFFCLVVGVETLGAVTKIIFRTGHTFLILEMPVVAVAGRVATVPIISVQALVFGGGEEEG